MTMAKASNKAKKMAAKNARRAAEAARKAMAKVSTFFTDAKFFNEAGEPITQSEWFAVGAEGSLTHPMLSRTIYRIWVTEHSTEWTYGRYADGSIIEDGFILNKDQKVLCKLFAPVLGTPQKLNSLAERA
jgi:hypothetical protein